MNKKLLFLTSLIAALLLAIGFISGTRAEASELHSVTTHYLDAAGEIQEETNNYDAWTETASLPLPTKEGVYIFLTDDVTLGGQYLINNIDDSDPAREIYIDLNGHTIYGGNNGRIICFNNTQGGVKVVITDSSEGKTGKLQGRGSHGMGGGGIYFRQGVLPNTLVLDGVTLQGATTTNWGAGIGATDAVDGSEQANLLLYKTNITNCTGKLGSALFLGTKFYTTRLYDVAISGCTSTESGAIYVKNGSAKMFGPNSSITNCTATKFGGAVYITGGSFTIEDVAISGCSAGNYGGAIYNTAGTFTMDGNSSIKKCYSKGDRGGAIHAENATTVINGGVIGGSTADKNYTQGSGFSAGLHIYAGTFRMTGGEISYQESVYGGANVALFQASDTNYAQATITGGTIKNGVLTGSNTSHSGGNICVYGHSTLTIGGETEENQPVISGGTNTVSGGYGGNIGLRNYASLTINGYATIADGSAIYGGAVFSPAGTTITMSNGTLSGNHSSNDGGAIHSKGTATITGGKIIKNYSTGGRGGAIYSASTIKLGNVTIGGSEADANHNGLEKQGGAIIVEGAAGDIEIDGATITYNHGGFGGNLVVQSTAKGTFKSGTIGYGKAEKYYAGNVAIFSSGTTFTMSGGEILGGEANTYGGNVVVRDAGITFTMTGGKISGGTATAHGSTFAINGAATVSVSDAEITDGELCLYGAGTLTITDSVIGDLKLNAGTVSLSGNKYNTVKAAEGSGFEKILSDGLLMEAPAAELIADGLAAVPGSYDGYAFKIAAEDKLTQFVPTISGTIAEKFGLTLQATASDLAGATVPVLRIAKRGADVDITDYTVEGGNYVFKFELNAEELTDNLNPRLVVGEVVVDERAEYAAVTYIKALAESAGATASLKALLADLVEFGAAAQKYYNYNTANLANAEANRWADYAPTDYAEPATVPDLAYQEGDATISVTRASLWLEDDTVAIRFRGVAPADAEFKLNDAAATAEFDGNSFTLTTQALKMSEVSEAVFTVTVTKESVTSSVTYGVATYVSRIRANSLNADMKALAERLWMYGISAKAYY